MTPTRPAPLRARIGNPLEWSYADKSLLLIGLYLLINLTFLLTQILVRRHPVLIPSWANPSAAGGFIAYQGAFVCLWVNLPARLESHCEPGRILISHATWGLVHDEISCIERGEIEVKGLHYPVKVYEVEEREG